jgi:hypothetical protein
MAEDAARELSTLPLEDALQLVHLYFERGSPKAEPAARRWLVRYLTEGSPGLRDVATVTASLEARARVIGHASAGPCRTSCSTQVLPSGSAKSANDA